MPMSGGWVFVIVVMGILNTMLFIKIWRATNKIGLIATKIGLIETKAGLIEKYAQHWYLNGFSISQIEEEVAPGEIYSAGEEDTRRRGSPLQMAEIKQPDGWVDRFMKKMYYP